jgi:hypothetical protein
MRFLFLESSCVHAIYFVFFLKNAQKEKEAVQLQEESSAPWSLEITFLAKNQRKHLLIALSPTASQT